MLLTSLYILNALAIVVLCLMLDTGDVIDSILHIIGYGIALVNGLFAAKAFHLLPGGVWGKCPQLLVANLLVSLFFAWSWSRRSWKNLFIKAGLILLTFLNLLAFFQ